MSDVEPDPWPAWAALYRKSRAGEAITLTGTVTGLDEAGRHRGLQIALRLPEGVVIGQLPWSQIARRPVPEEQLPDWIGRELEVEVIKLSPALGVCVVSHRVIHERAQAEERRERWEAFRRERLSTLSVGSVLEGVVKNITDYGAFIDLGGVDGMLHRRSMGLAPGQHPGQVVSVGEEVTVEVETLDVDSLRITLTLGNAS